MAQEWNVFTPHRMNGETFDGYRERRASANQQRYGHARAINRRGDLVSIGSAEGLLSANKRPVGANRRAARRR